MTLSFWLCFESKMCTNIARNSVFSRLLQYDGSTFRKFCVMILNTVLCDTANQSRLAWMCQIYLLSFWQICIPLLEKISWPTGVYNKLEQSITDIFVYCNVVRWNATPLVKFDIKSKIWYFDILSPLQIGTSFNSISVTYRLTFHFILYFLLLDLIQ